MLRRGTNSIQRGLMLWNRCERLNRMFFHDVILPHSPCARQSENTTLRCRSLHRSNPVAPSSHCPRCHIVPIVTLSPSTRRPVTPPTYHTTLLDYVQIGADVFQFFSDSFAARTVSTMIVLPENTDLSELYGNMAMLKPLPPLLRGCGKVRPHPGAARPHSSATRTVPQTARAAHHKT